MKNTKKLLALLLVVAMVFALAVPVFADEETPAMAGKTVILHSNDVHGAIAGYANMAALAADYEKQGAQVIVADAGDFSQGKVEVSSNKGLNAVRMMNAAGYDIATLGNHEFDYGYAQLVANLKEAKFGTVCCNVLGEDGKPVLDGSKVITVGDVKIGFIGVNTPESQTKANPALIKGLTWLAGDNMVKAVQAEADKLKAEADVIVVLAHLGVDAESKPNRSTDLWAGLKGVDFIIDGHSHTVMTAGEAGEPIQSTGTAFQNIGVIVIDNATKKIESNKLVEITADSAKDETVAAAAQAITDAINKEYGTVFAKNEVKLNGDKAYNKDTGLYGNRDGETNLGNLITDSMVWTVKKSGGVTVDEKHIVAVTNGGGIRAAINPGDITKKDVNTVLPFGNTIAVVYITGAELLEALEASTYCVPASTIGGFPQVAGISYTINSAKAYDANPETYPGSTYYGPKTINRVTINSINGEPFDAKATYAVITNNFCAGGGDTYYAFASATSKFDTGIPLDEALMDYITTELKGTIGQEYAAPKGNITHVYKPFKDVVKGAYYYDAVMWAFENNVTKGIGNDMFGPDNRCTRAEIVTFLYRAAGSPAVAEDAANPFSDVEKGSFYYDAVLWAVKNNITVGTSATTFEPNAVCNRAQIVTFLWRANGSELTPIATRFADVPADAFYADAVAWAAQEGITTGYNTTTFAPEDNCTRAQAVTLLYRAK